MHLVPKRYKHMGIPKRPSSLWNEQPVGSELRNPVRAHVTHAHSQTKISNEKAVEKYIASMKKYEAERRKVIFIGDTKVEAQTKNVLICKAVTNDGKPCKFKVNVQYKCFCTRHGKN
jgi:hypothetical protein